MVILSKLVLINCLAQAITAVKTYNFVTFKRNSTKSGEIWRLDPKSGDFFSPWGRLHKGGDGVQNPETPPKIRRLDMYDIYDQVTTTVLTTGIFQGCFGDRISAPVRMEKGPVFSQRVDEISQSEAPQTISNFSSIIHKYLIYLKPRSHILCNCFATSPRLTISTDRRGRNKVPDRSRRGCREVGD